MSESVGEEGRVVGRYGLYDELAAGGMATVHLGRLIGSVGFSRAVAIKKMHSFLAHDPEFVAMFLDEARVAGRIRHPNVVPTLDVVSDGGELFLVMEYVLGESLNRLLIANKKRELRTPLDITSAIVIGLLEGLHAAHEAKDERGAPLEVVHRDVSPQNVIVGADGIARVFDFGIAKAVGRMQTTQDGSLRGKIAYMSPEQLSNEPIDARTDVWAAGVVLWEMIANSRLFVSDSAGALVHLVMTKEVPKPSSLTECSPALDAVVKKALATDREDRFPSARAMSRALEAAVPPASPHRVASWLEELAGPVIAARAARMEEMERAGVERPNYGTIRTKLAALGFEKTPDSEAARSTMTSLQVDTLPFAITPSTPPLPLPAPSALPPRARPRKKSAMFPLVALTTMLVTLLIAWRVLPRYLAKPSSPTRASSVAPDAPVSIASPAEPGPSADPAPLAATPAPPTPSASASATASASALASSALAARKAPRGRSTASSPVPPHPAPNCDPPYTIGPPPDLIKKPKLECLPP